MKKQVKLTILAEDIMNNRYLDVDKCPITQALKREGLDLIDAGVGIKNYYSGAFVLTDNDPAYQELRNNVTRMYDHKHERRSASDGAIPPADFSTVLELDLPE